MNIILTNSFIKKFKKDFRKYHFSIYELINQLKKSKPLNLEKPYSKVKLKLNNISIRWIVLININNKLLPIYLVLKKDKTKWENLLIDKDIDKILKKILLEINEDLKTQNFIEYK